MIKVEIDEGSGFCFGVVTAIHKAEEELAKGETLYCLGDIVHNSREVDRLKAMGLITINRDEFRQLRNAKVLLRAHGEPPETYQIAQENNIEIIDATCPVVLRLQKRIKQEFRKEDFEEKQIVIYGKTVTRKCWDWWDKRVAKPLSSKVRKKPKSLISAKVSGFSRRPPNLWMSFRRLWNTSNTTFHRMPLSNIMIRFAAKLPTVCPISESLRLHTILSFSSAEKEFEWENAF